MARIFTILLSIFLTVSVGVASNNDEGQVPPVQVFTSDAHGRTIRVPSDQDSRNMHLRIVRFQDDLSRIGQEGARRGVTSAGALIQAERSFKDDILMCPFRSLRAKAYEALSLSVLDLDNFTLAFSYALYLQDEEAEQLYQGYKRMHEQLARQFRPQVNEQDAKMKQVVQEMLKRIDEIVKEERARHQRRIAEPNNPEHDHHPLEIKRLKQMEQEQTLKTLAGVSRTISNVARITMCVVLFYAFVKALAYKII